MWCRELPIESDREVQVARQYDFFINRVASRDATQFAHYGLRAYTGTGYSARAVSTVSTQGPK